MVRSEELLTWPIAAALTAAANRVRSGTTYQGRQREGAERTERGLWSFFFFTSNEVLCFSASFFTRFVQFNGGVSLPPSYCLGRPKRPPPSRQDKTQKEGNEAAAAAAAAQKWGKKKRSATSNPVLASSPTLIGEPRGLIPTARFWRGRRGVPRGPLPLLAP